MGFLHQTIKIFTILKQKVQDISKNAILGWQQFLPKIAGFSFNKKITLSLQFGATPIQNIFCISTPNEKRDMEEK